MNYTSNHTLEHNGYFVQYETKEDVKDMMQ
jgi:hypothetical protein